MSFSVERKKAQFSPGDVPPGSVCLSSFVAVTRGIEILVGRMNHLETWVEKFYVSPNVGSTVLTGGKYLLPASHLQWYESPLEASERILREEALLDLPSKSLQLVDVQSHLRASANDASVPHWDICFVYKADYKSGELKRPEWFKDFGFKSNLKADDFARGHGDVLEEAGLLQD